jgi:hypothetical protein
VNVISNPASQFFNKKILPGMRNLLPPSDGFPTTSQVWDECKSLKAAFEMTMICLGQIT